MYYKIGTIIAIVFFVFFLLPALEIALKYFKVKCSDFINERETTGKIKPKIFTWPYYRFKKTHDKLFPKVEYTFPDYAGLLPISFGVSLLLIYIWPLLLPLAAVYISLIILRKIKRHEKFVKTLKK
jgi:uncharacterized membrane protein YciS (DUF1049 family)